MPWWEKNTQRLIQTNLRAKDAALDRQSLMATLKDLSCNVLLLNTGGLMAFYPSELPYHYRSPFLGEGDLTGDMVRLCHDNGIRFMARFDVSKIHESIFEKYPQWAYRSPRGETINYNGMVHTCVNSPFQRDCTLEILSEAACLYPIDGIFFNMFGYQTRDYANNYHGICHCKGCIREFKARYGEELPAAEDPLDPVFQLYQAFKEETVKEMIDRIHTLVKGISPEIAIATYTDYKVDIIKKESNTEIHRPLPVWEYSSSENHQSVEGSWDDKIISNVCINATSLDYRFMGVHRPHAALRLYQALASGAGMDFCIIGVFDDYPDRKNISVVKEIYGFHKKHEAYFGCFQNVGDLVLIKPGPGEIPQKEYQGLFKILKESHLQFRVVEQHALRGDHLEGAQAILCADLVPTEAILARLEEAQEKGVPIIWVGTAWAKEDSPRFKRLFSVAQAGPPEDARWSYLLNQPTTLFKGLKETDWTLLDGPLVPLEGIAGCDYGLERIGAGFFGPPELCGGNEPLGHYAFVSHPERKTILIPFQPGWMYMRYGYDEYRIIIENIILHKAGLDPSLRIEAHPMVEVFASRYGQNEKGALYNMALINLSGYNGVGFHEPLVQRGIPISLVMDEGHKPRSLVSLRTGQEIPFKWRDRVLSFTLAELKDFEMLLVRS
ncbi:MAG: hypothetical protein FWH12_05410 [Treponema sp.]|nr:hypothetical protein [Treponema sp.]